MTKQITYKDVEIGDEIPILVKHPTTRQLVKWAAASGDYNELHYDKDLALLRGFPAVIVHGTLVTSFLAQLITSWIGEVGTLKKLGCTFPMPHHPDEDIVCKGKISKKYIQDDEYIVVCDIWTEKPDGQKGAVGMAIVSLPN